MSIMPDMRSLVKEFGRIEILLAGRGGQGILLAGLVLSKTLTKLGLYVVESEHYSAETRGGDSRSEIIVYASHDDVDLIRVDEASIAIFMYPQQMVKFKHLVSPSPILVLYDNSFGPPPWRPPRLLSHPMTLEAQRIGSFRIANMVMLGVLSGLGLLPLNTLLEVVREVTPAKWMEYNVKAVKRGYEIGASVRPSQLSPHSSTA